MDEVINYIEENKDKYLEQLFEYLRIPSVSAEKKHSDDVKKAANWTAEHLKSIGMENVESHPEKGRPIIYADWLKAGSDKPTVLIYGHYDVQPVDPIEEWSAEPFEPVIKNGKIWGRGTSDDKGQLFTHFKALEAYLKTKGELPVNVKLLVEGEEEAQTSCLDDFIVNNQEKLACDVALVSDTEWFADGLPSVCYALRGIAFAEVTYVAANSDLHSGTYGGAVDNPIEALCYTLSRLKDRYGRITIPGIYDDVVELSEEERENIRALPFDEGKYRERLGLKSTKGEHDFNTLERVWARPALDINGINGGFVGEGVKTVLPSKASAKMSIRLAPNQKSKDVAEKLKNYLLEITPPTMKAKVETAAGGDPVLVPIDSEPIKAATKAFEKAFGKKVAYMREGGSIPITEVFQNVLNAAPALMGLGLPDDNIHAPNESFAVNNFYGGIKASAYFLDEYSK